MYPNVPPNVPPDVPPHIAEMRGNNIPGYLIHPRISMLASLSFGCANKANGRTFTINQNPVGLG